MVREAKRPILVSTQNPPLCMYIILVDGKPLTSVAYRIDGDKKVRHGNFNGIFYTERGLDQFFKRNKLCDHSGNPIRKSRITIAKVVYKNCVSKIDPVLLYLD